MEAPKANKKCQPTKDKDTKNDYNYYYSCAKHSCIARHFRFSSNARTIVSVRFLFSNARLVEK